jgi:hypothetical protein
VSGTAAAQCLYSQLWVSSENLIQCLSPLQMHVRWSLGAPRMKEVAYNAFQNRSGLIAEVITNGCLEQVGPRLPSSGSHQGSARH